MISSNLGYEVGISRCLVVSGTRCQWGRYDGHTLTLRIPCCTLTMQNNRSLKTCCVFRCEDGMLKSTLSSVTTLTNRYGVILAFACVSCRCARNRDIIHAIDSEVTNDDVRAKSYRTVQHQYSMIPAIAAHASFWYRMIPQLIDYLASFWKPK